MSEDSDIEIYRQRYDTFRHLDRMRYQLLQILVAFGGAVAIFFRFKSDPAEWWFLLLVGVMLLLIGYAMLRVSKGLWANNDALRKIGRKIGDTDIPPPQASWYRSVSCWIYVVVLFLGALFTLIGLVDVVSLVL